MNKQTQKELLDIVKNNYQEIANHYSETRKKKLWPAIIDLADKIKDGDKILDVGCGSGKLLDALIEKNIKYIGVDPCESLLEHARNRYKGENNLKLDNIKFLNNDIMSLGDIPETEFDFVFSIAVLQHIPSKDLQIKALKQLKNKIKTDGRVILSVWNMWSKSWEKKKFKKKIWKFFFLRLIGKNKMDFGDIIFDWKNSEGNKVSRRYYHAFRKKELKKITKKAGFKIEKIFKDKYNFYLILKK